MVQRLAVVTGASSGIGAATAELLGASGWRVVLVARRQPALEEVALRIEAVGGEAVVEPLDGGDAEAVQAMATRVLDGFGVPGAVVNAAGAGKWRWPEETLPADMERMLDAPFRSAYHHTHAFLSPMLAQRGGVIVHVGSPAALRPWPSATAYTCSRWALRGLHEALVQDLHGTGVRSCHVIFAGEVASDYFVANPGSHEHIPVIGRVFGVASPRECAEVVYATILRPRNQVLHPGLARAFNVVNQVAPGGMRWLARVTGRRR
jgi:NADP-dependent 3-hydroxy acid dehydrogenase YdfG